MSLDLRKHLQQSNGGPAPTPPPPDDREDSAAPNDHASAGAASERPALLAARWLGRGREQAPPGPQRVRRPVIPEPEEPGEGLAVETPPAVAAHIAGIEEAKARVHRRLIQELEAS